MCAGALVHTTLAQPDDASASSMLEAYVLPLQPSSQRNHPRMTKTWLAAGHIRCHGMGWLSEGTYAAMAWGWPACGMVSAGSDMCGAA